MRVLLVLAAASCAFVALVANNTWGWFGIDYDPQLHRSYLSASLMFVALSLLPWSDWLRRYGG